MLIFAYLAPEVEHNDAFGNPVSSPINHHLVKDEPFCHRCGLWMYNLDIAVVPLIGFSDIDRRSALLWNTSLTLLCGPRRMPVC